VGLSADPPWVLDVGKYRCDLKTMRIARRSPLGGSCTLNPECEPGLRCDNGACAPGFQGGHACTGDDCAANLFCDTTRLMCFSRKPLGAPCASLDECASQACGDVDGAQVCIMTEVAIGEACGPR